MNNNDKVESELREEYFNLFDNKPSRKNRGIPYGYISGPLGLVWLIAFGVFSFYFADNGSALLLVVGAVSFWLFFFLPRFFYEERKRTRRYVKRHFPIVYKTLKLLEEPGKRDFVASGFPLLDIDVKKYFLAYYIYQRKWDPKPNAKFTGYALVDSDGTLIEDENTFKKAFLTYNYSLLGAVSTQNLEETRKRFFRDRFKSYVKPAIKRIKAHKDYFEKRDCLQDWKIMTDHLDILEMAVKEALTIFRCRDNYRYAEGYSFGFEYSYENALIEQKTRKTFARYMQTAYGEKIGMIRVLSARLYQAQKESTGFIQKISAMQALRTIRDYVVELSNLIDRMNEQGITSEDELKLFHEKLAYAKTIGLIS